MRHFWFACLAAVTAASPLGAAPPQSAAPLFEGKDLFGLQWATDPQIRPDGRMVAYVRASHDVMTDQVRRALWLVDAETGTQTPLVSGPGSHFSPRWSPDGTRLAYVSSAEGGRSQLFVRWLQTGQSSRIADLTDAPDELAWSRDGKSIAFTMFTPDDPMQLGNAPAKPEGAQWAAPLVVITNVTYRADGVGQLKPG
ncbi:MAG TPA: DPP IV N-terminal domain-containing protein, partial [Steroidobacteraceae bacterium]|nr:DPP IV N-terminal domain-containing protein [Steroidobacteraceae bacterium]